MIRAFIKGGFDHVCVHQVGPDQEGFMRFYAREILPKLSKTVSSSGKDRKRAA